jgi:hypothetical protein
MVFCFLFAVSTGCERMETAVDTYTKVKKDAQQKSEEAQNEAKKIVDEKLKKIGDEPLKEAEEDGDEDD